MEKILLYDESQQLFDDSQIASTLQRIPCISAIRTAPDVVAAVEADFTADDEIAIVRLGSSKRMLSIQGSQNAVVRAAFALNENVSQKLRIIDEGYTFDLGFEGVASADALLALLLSESNLE